MLNRNFLIKLTIALVMSCSLLSFFMKPKTATLELVMPKEELPSYKERFPKDTSLADRVIKSYELAMILVQSPFTQNNISALESIREWARDQFQSHPDFLHPVSLTVEDTHRDTVFGAAGYNLLAPIRCILEEQTGELLRLRISGFHGTNAFRSFNKAYFDFFGRDSEAATLLARYESERARQAVDVILWTLVWAAAIVAAALNLFKRGRSRDFYSALQKTTACTWGLLGVQYLMQCWDGSQNATLISCVTSLLVAMYLFRPVILATHQEGGQQLLVVRLAPKWIAMAAWVTFSLLAIQVLTWVRTGLPNGSDPVTLLLCSFTGNFVHEPVGAKHIITTVVGLAWLGLTLWSWRQHDKDETFIANVDEGFKSLEKAVDFQATESFRVK